MALEVVNGRVQFKFDLGSGPATIITDKIVNNGKWHQVIAERLLINSVLICNSTDRKPSSLLV